MKELHGKVAVITGAASGFGREFAIRCADEGMKVVLTDIDTDGLGTTVALLKPGTESLVIGSDVSSADNIEHLARSKTKSIHQCWTERDGAPRAALTRSVFPEDAMAVIYKPARSAMTSGKARTRDWKLRFEPRSCPFIEPLTGWTGSDDTLAQVELTFPSAAAAVAYA